jgi:ABC-type phosphate transport system substrate-binding protein
LIIAALAALTMAGCGSSKSSTSGTSTASSAPGGTTAGQTSGSSAAAGHTSEWSQAQTQEAEGDLSRESQGEGLSAAFKQCLIKGVEATFSPGEYKKDNAEDKEADKARGIAEACAKKYPPKGSE